MLSANGTRISRKQVTRRYVHCWRVPANGAKHMCEMEVKLSHLGDDELMEDSHGNPANFSTNSCRPVIPGWRPGYPGASGRHCAVCTWQRQQPAQRSQSLCCQVASRL